MSRSRFLLVLGVLLVAAGLSLVVFWVVDREAPREITTTVPPATTTTTVRESLPGTAEIRAGDMAAARAAIEAYLEDNPEDRQVRYLLGLTYEREGDLEGALLVYQDMVEEDPGEFEAYFRIGEIHRRQGALEAAAGSYQASLDANPDFTAARLALAETWAAMGDPDGAISLYFEVLDMRPMGVHLDQIRVALARLLLQVGQQDNAEIQLNRALVDNPDNEEARVLLDELAEAAGPAPTAPEGQPQEPDGATDGD
jgi:tetratricopeptide (TPR) repeat protein